MIGISKGKIVPTLCTLNLQHIYLTLTICLNKKGSKGGYLMLSPGSRLFSMILASERMFEHLSLVYKWQFVSNYGDIISDFLSYLLSFLRERGGGGVLKVYF